MLLAAVLRDELVIATKVFGSAQTGPDQQGLSRKASLREVEASLLYREEEREMLPLCVDEGVAVMAWSPLAWGRLTRAAQVSTPRLETDAYGRQLFAQSEAADQKVIEAVEALDVMLTSEERQVLESPYVQHAVVGFS